MPIHEINGLELSRRASLKLTTGVALASLSPIRAFAGGETTSEIVANRRDQPFDSDWRFFRGDGDDLLSPACDDTGWRRINLPHDWSIEDRNPNEKGVNAEIRDVDTAPLWQAVTTPPRAIGPFNAEFSVLGDMIASEGAGSTGYTVGGIGWYRKHFRMPELATDANVELVFDGAYMNSEVWLNGKHLGSHPNGYTPFAVDLTPHLMSGADNVLAVRVTNLGRNSRWYSGSGIYRHVRLNVTSKLRFARWGVGVTTPTVSSASASVDVRTTVEGLVPATMLVVRIKDASGKIVSETREAAAEHKTLKLPVSKPNLWSPKTPYLYHVECELKSGDRMVDKMTTKFGIRRVEIDAAQGLRINGEPYKLRGGCVHHDNGLLGAAAIARAEERRVELLKARGFNAIRTSHNPPSLAFLDACDRLGMLVMEEAFDMWREGKNVDDYHVYFDGWWREDLAAMVRRDGNHPSIIMWSIGNEIPDKLKSQGIETARMLAEEMHRLDPTRPVTEAINGGTGTAIVRADGTPDQTTTQFLDVAGYNYKFREAEHDHAQFPQRVIVGTESVASDVDAIWRLTDQHPYLIGDFVWTAMDYIGEAAIGKSDVTSSHFDVTGKYPWLNANCGDIDLIGQQKPQSLLRDVVWGVSPIEMSVQRPLDAGARERTSLWGWRDELQSWTWPSAEGRPITVSVYTRGDRVELTLNGKAIGEMALTEADHAIARFTLPYAPGRLVATAFQNSKVIGKHTLETAGPAAGLRLKVDRPRINAERNDLCYVTAEVIDEAGRLIPDAVNVLELSMTGPVALAAFGNANPRGVGSFQQPVAKTWHGRALAILRPTGAAGVAAVKIGSKDLKSATTNVLITSRLG